MPQKIAEKLNEFKEVMPDGEWSTRNRALLLSQIGVTQDGRSERTSLWIIFLRIFGGGVMSIRPVYGVMMLLSIFLGTGIMGYKAVGQAKPGDSLYSTKRATERAQLALTFDDRGKASLGIAIASKRANEMSVLVKSNSSEGEKAVQVKNLASDLKSEIEAVKSRIAKVYPVATKKEMAPAKVESKPVVEIAKRQATSTKRNVDSQGTKKSSDSMFIANSGKTDQGIALGEAKKTDDGKLEMIINDSQKTLEQANESLTKNDYNEALKKLDEAGKSMQEIK